jgi:hypothetical protein
VERVALEGLDAFDAGQLRHVQRPGAHADELRGEVVAAIGADIPARFRRIPGEAHDLGVEQRVVVEAVLFADALAVREDFRRMRIFLRRHVTGFFEQRHVDHRRRIALRARIPVPVPGAAEVAALLDDADILIPASDKRAAVASPAKPPPIKAKVTWSSSDRAGVTGV